MLAILTTCWKCNLSVLQHAARSLTFFIDTLLSIDQQPEGLTQTVEISNIVFSVIFAVEMLLKVIAEGPLNYMSSGFNVFDGVIVILR